jgi:hypothetical protein
MSVLMPPGATQLTVTFFSPASVTRKYVSLKRIADALTDSHAPGEGLDGTLGARVDGVLGHTLGLTSDGSHQDDAATNFHPLVRLLGDEELTTGVDVEDTVELLRLDIGEVTERDDTRIGAADIEATEVGDDIVHQL